MKTKPHIEPIFFGIAAMAFTTALVSLFYATRQVQISDTPTQQSNPFGEVVIREVYQTNEQQDQLAGYKNEANEDISLTANINYELALKLIRGNGDQHDLATAYEHLTLIVHNDFPKRAEAAYELAKLYRKVPSTDCQNAAVIWFKKSAAWGYRKAHLMLAKSYLRGLGTTSSFNLAVDHYRIAGKMGSASGAFALVELIGNGALDTMGNKDLARSTLQEFMPMLEKDALAGNGHAARSVGRLYLSGELLTQNLEQAQYWLTKAANVGDAVGMNDLAVLQLEQVSEEESASSIISLLHRSAQLGYSSAMTTLGRLHLQEKFSLEKADAVRWFNLGVDAGHAGSMEELSRLYLEGDLVEVDLGKAEKLAERGAMQRHTGSIEILKKITAASNQKLAAKE